MKKLLIDVNSIVHGMVTGRISGIGRTTLELVSALEKIEDLPFDVTLYSQNMKGIGASYFSDKFKKVHFYLPHRQPVNKGLGKVPVKDWVCGYDLMHIPRNFEYVNSPEKTIFTLHDAFFMKIDDPNFNYKKMRREVPVLMNQAKGIITCSESSKKDIVETMSIDPDKIHVIYWGYDRSTFKPKGENNFELIQKKYGINNPYFMTYSCNTGRKNSDKLIKAFLKFLKKGGDKDLVLVWSKPPEEILSIVKNSSFRNRVHFLQHIEDSQLALLLQHSEAMIFPSLYEGFGLPVLEALACGTLVLTGNNSSLPEVGGDTAFYLDDLSVEGIYKGMLNLSSNLSNRESYIKNGIKQAQKFSWDETALKYVELYKNYLGV